MEKQTSVWKTGITFGILYGIVAVLLAVIFYVTNNTYSNINKWMGIVVLIIFIVFAQLVYKKSNNGFMSVGQGITVGIILTILGSLIFGIFNMVLTKYIDPSLIDQMRIAYEEQWLQKGMSEEQAAGAVEMAIKFQANPIIMILTVLFGGALTGLIISAITALFIKKNPEKAF